MSATLMALTWLTGAHHFNKQNGGREGERLAAHYLQLVVLTDGGYPRGAP